MRDWHEEVRARVAAARLAPEQEAEIVEELAQHLGDRYEALTSHGMSDAEATRIVLEELSNAEELSRELRAVGARGDAPSAVPGVRGTGSLFGEVHNDIRYALRSMRRSPSFTAIAVLCMALGIGATSTIFGIVDTLYFRPPAGVGDPGAIVRPYIARRTATFDTGPTGSPRVSYPEYVALRDNARSLSGLAAFDPVALSIGRGVSTERADGLLVSGNFFSVLEVQPALGRFFVSEEDAGPGSPAAVVISYKYWQGHFGGDSTVIGKSIRIEGEPYPIVGIAPAGFHGIDAGSVDIWMPVSRLTRGAPTNWRTDPYQIWIWTVGRLAPGVTHEQATADLQRIIRNVAKRVPPMPGVAGGLGLDAKARLTLGPIFAARGPRPSEQATIARWLALAAVLVLAIACANTANLLLARAATRRKEIAIRLALGAGRWRLTRALLTESVLLAGLGAVGGLVVAFWGTRLVPTVGLPPLHFFAQGRVLVFAVSAAVICGILFGLAPALGASRTALTGAMKEGAREGSDQRSRLRSGLMVAQVALAVLLLTGAGLFVHSLRNVQAIDPGFDLAHLMNAYVDLHGAGYTSAEAAAFYDRAAERLRAVPGVAEVTVNGLPPLAGDVTIMRYTIPGRDVSARGVATADAGSTHGGGTPAAYVTPATYFVGAHYFSTIGTPMRQGRDFTANDRRGRQPVTIVNEAFAKRTWPNETALGKCIDIGGTCYTVIGVAANAKYRDLKESQRAVFFLPIAQRPPGQFRMLLIRTAGDPSTVVPSVRRVLQSMDDKLSYAQVETLVDRLRPDLQPRRLGASMFSAFGLLALVLAAIGLYGVVSYSVAQRTREVGIRMALGAQRGDVLSLVVRQGAVLTIIGLVLGLAAALGTTHLVTHLLFGVSATDPVTFVGVCVVLAAVAALASYLPARRATRVDPIIALRSE
jgi:predicted permease